MRFKRFIVSTRNSARAAANYLWRIKRRRGRRIRLHVLHGTGKLSRNLWGDSLDVSRRLADTQHIAGTGQDSRKTYVFPTYFCRRKLTAHAVRPRQDVNEAGVQVCTLRGFGILHSGEGARQVFGRRRRAALLKGHGRRRPRASRRFLAPIDTESSENSSRISTSMCSDGHGGHGSSTIVTKPSSHASSPDRARSVTF